MKQESQIVYWRAVEALRAGVPNRDAVRFLGCSQPKIEEQFRKLMSAMTDSNSGNGDPEGIFIAGDFGCGKSHLLEYLRHLSLENNFVCSKIVIGKETKLYDPAKVYTAAIQSARVPDSTGPVLESVVQKLKYNSSEYADFFKWLNDPNSVMRSHFTASVYIAEYEKDAEIINRIIRFWAGDKIGVRELRGWLRELGQAATYKIDKTTVKELALQRYQFIPRLMRAAGYAGWIILVDEVELVARYSLPQRAKSYAQIARLLGSLEDSRIPGLSCVLAISKAYEGDILDARDDESKILGKLRAGANNEDMLLASQAEKGIKEIYNIKKKQMFLDNVPNTQQLYDKISQIHANAYDWEPPDVFQSKHEWNIRQHIKRWINELDLRRLDPLYKPDIIVDSVHQTFSEMPELEEDSSEDSQENDAST